MELDKILYKESSLQNFYDYSIKFPTEEKYIQRFFNLTDKTCASKLIKKIKIDILVQPSWSEGGSTRHNFGRGPSNDYFIKVWFQLSNWFQTRRFLCEFPIGSYVKLSSAVGAILVEGRNCLTNFWNHSLT
jgi:hypothetical protein